MTAGRWHRDAGGSRLLLLVPVVTYVVSYLFLACYHGQMNLWHTVVHESGRLTLLENIFYASHFLGHVPVLVTISLVFAGSWLSMAPVAPNGSPLPVRRLVAAIGLLLVVSATISIWHFGSEDTVSFLLQQKQRPDLYTQGGSWNLHLPSTMLQLLLIPVVVWVARRAFGRPVEWSRRGLGLLAAAVVCAVAVTWLANDRPLAAVAAVWADPRYLAHAVRELATFPLTYYPIPLALLLAGERPGQAGLLKVGPPDLVLILAAIFCGLGCGWMVATSLASDIGTLAQRPDFAKGGELSIPYLLASHYFEHFLDSLFFALLSIFLVKSLKSKVRGTAGGLGIRGSGSGTRDIVQPWRNS